MNKKLIKYIFIGILTIILIIAFSTSYNAHNIDNLAYVVALGIDSSDNGNSKYTFQFTNISGSDDLGKSELVTDSVESSSIDTAINLMNSYMGKELNLAHCKIIVFSEEVAQNSIEKEIYSLINNPQLRPTSNVIITKCETEQYIKKSKPALENLVTKYYEIFPFSSKYTGYTEDVRIGNFFSLAKFSQKNPTAMLGGINTSNYAASSTETNIANSTSIKGSRETETIGLSVFDDSLKMVGELNTIESLCHMIVSNQVRTFVISVPDPNNNDSTIDLSVRVKNAPKTNVELINGTPYITTDIKLTSKILTVNSETQYLNKTYLESISNSSNFYLKNEIEKYLYKTSKEFNSDIDGFGYLASKKFSTLANWDNFDWQNSYKDAFFKVNVNSNVTSTLLIT